MTTHKITAGSYTATLDTETSDVTITRDGFLVGGGAWNGAMIIDCDARLADDDDECEAAYDALDAGLCAAISALDAAYLVDVVGA